MASDTTTANGVTTDGTTNGSAKHVPPPSDEKPSSSQLTVIGELPILTADGKSIPFSSLYKTGRHLVIFIRHFFCGMCEDYVRALSETLPSTTPVSIVGCGDPALIQDYASRTGCPFAIYADPTNKLYDELQLVVKMARGDNDPAYQRRGLTRSVIQSMWNTVSSGTYAWKGGKVSQNGGEFLFDGGQVVWCHRMQNTRDHTEVEDLKALL